MTTFKKRGLRVKFELSQGAFNDRKDNTIEIDGLAVRARIEIFGNMTANAQIMVYGLPMEIMNRLVTIRATTEDNAWMRNVVSIEVIGSEGVESQLFTGFIWRAVSDFNAAPDIPLVISASETYEAMMNASRTFNFVGVTPVSNIIQALANANRLGFVNHGVSKTLSDVSLNGDTYRMMRQICVAANIHAYIENNVIHILPQGQARERVPAVEISRYTGMVGYPRPIDFGCSVTCIYDPKYKIAAKAILVVPEIPVIEGNMVIRAITHTVDSELPQGQWFTNMVLNRHGAQ